MSLTIYEIDTAIIEAAEALQEVFDEDTGEVYDIDRFEQLKADLDALQMERDKKISNVACWIKNLKAEAEAIKLEKMNLAKRQQVAENKAESLKKYLEYALHGEKFEDARCKISYRKSEGIHFADDFQYSTLPPQFVKVTVDAKKTELKAALKNGEEIPGVSLVSKNNLIIK